uniref:SET domain-containing protein n=1 Tax=Cyprinus carpio TaxID=7962 RepID=A0A8C2FHL0_CYPCA
MPRFHHIFALVFLSFSSKLIVFLNQNRGIYMFRINNEHVIDATLTGGPARYVNHSCAPNCVAEVVTFDKEDKIIIISSRRIPKGEEVSYSNLSFLAVLSSIGLFSSITLCIILSQSS